jgi:hypothetical protein
MSKVLAIILLLFIWSANQCQAGTVDRFTIRLLLNGCVQIVKRYPLMTGLVLAILFRKELVNFVFEKREKQLVTLIGEHPIISVATGLCLVKLCLDLSAGAEKT